MNKKTFFFILDMARHKKYLQKCHFYTSIIRFKTVITERNRILYNLVVVAYVL